MQISTLPLKVAVEVMSKANESSFSLKPLGVGEIAMESALVSPELVTESKVRVTLVTGETVILSPVLVNPLSTKPMPKLRKALGTGIVLSSVSVVTSITATAVRSSLSKKLLRTNMRLPSGEATNKDGPASTTSSMVEITVLVLVAMTETLLSDWLAIYNLVPSGVTARPTGSLPTEMVSVTVLVAVLIAFTVLPVKSAT